MEKTLSAIIHEAENLTNQLLETGGEITPELESLLAMSGKEFKEKLDAYGYVIDGLKSRHSYAISRMKEWEHIATQCERGLENITERIKNAMNTMDLPDIHGFEYTFRLQANPPKVIIDDENLIPGEFKVTETITTTKIQKKEIMDALKSGITVPGAHSERGLKLVTKPSQRKELVGKV